MTEIRLLIVDDQAAIREALAVMLDLDPSVAVVGTAATGQEALELADALAPDVVLMDLNMPVMGGVEATAALQQRHPEAAVVVLTSFEDDESILGALQAGARGYLTKDADRSVILQAVQSAFAGNAVLDPSVQLRLLALASSRPAGAPASGGGAAVAPADPHSAAATAIATQLTGREREILDLIGRGLKNREIAATLIISEATVKTHINNLFSKADLHSRADAVRLALTLAAGA